jgi:hypothetical protein
VEIAPLWFINQFWGILKNAAISTDQPQADQSQQQYLDMVPPGVMEKPAISGTNKGLCKGHGPLIGWYRPMSIAIKIPFWR